MKTTTKIDINAYAYENENAKLLMEKIIETTPICLPTDELITEELALRIYNQIINTPEQPIVVNGTAYVPCFNLSDLKFI